MAAPTITPAQQKAYDEAAAAALAKVKEALADGGWAVSKTEKQTTISTKSVPGISFTSVKGEVVIPKSVPLEKVVSVVGKVQALTGSEPEEVRAGLSFRKVAGSNEWSEGLLHLGLESPSGPVSHRDFCVYRKHFAEGSAHYFVQVSVENAWAGEVKGYVRGKIVWQGYVVQPVDAGTKFTFVALVDPAGSLPAAIYNLVATKQGLAAQRYYDQLTK